MAKKYTTTAIVEELFRIKPMPHRKSTSSILKRLVDGFFMFVNINFCTMKGIDKLPYRSKDIQALYILLQAT